MMFIISFYGVPVICLLFIDNGISVLLSLLSLSSFKFFSFSLNFSEEAYTSSF